MTGATPQTVTSLVLEDGITLAPGITTRLPTTIITTGLVLEVTGTVGEEVVEVEGVAGGDKVPLEAVETTTTMDGTTRTGE